MSMHTQESLDSLRHARNKLYEIAPHTLSSWSLEDQEKYSDDMHRIVQQIMRIEYIKTNEGNKKLNKYEDQLKSASNNLEKYANNDSNLLHMVRSINNGLGAIDEIIELVR